MKEPYWMAADCPNCGQKDSHEAWRGARRSSSSWGHDYPCCSDKCGMEFATSRKRIERDLQSARDKQRSVNREVRELREELRHYTANPQGKES